MSGLQETPAAQRLDDLHVQSDAVKLRRVRVQKLLGAYLHLSNRALQQGREEQTAEFRAILWVRGSRAHQKIIQDIQLV